MKKSALVLALLLLMNLVLTVQLPQGGGKYTYVYEVEDTGWTHIMIKFEGKGAGKSWVLVPKFREYDLKLLSGSITEKRVINKTDYYFYANLTFSYKENTSFEIRWSYRFGALIIEPNGVFFSTQIGFSRLDSADILVKLPKEFESLEVEPRGYRISEDEVSRYVKYHLEGSLNNTMRVLIAFKVKKTEFLTKKVGNLEIIYPPRYEDLAQNISKYYQGVISEIMDYTASDQELNIKVKFFVPGSMKEITTLGYTGPRYTSDVITPGVVNLNMMLVRMISTELPNTLTHELLHQYMQYSGLTVDLRWAHEGLAQYLSGVIVKDALGMDGTFEKEAEDAVKFVDAQTGGDYGFLVSWRGGGLPENPYLYYSASLALIYKLAKEFGGPSIYKKFFHEVRKDGAKVDTLAKFVYYLSKATGKDLIPFLTKLGIPREAMITSTAEKMMSAAEQYVTRTRWINPLTWISQGLLERARGGSGPSSEAILFEVIAITYLGILMDAAIVGVMAAIIGGWIIGRSKAYEELKESEALILEPFGLRVEGTMKVTPEDLGLEGEGLLYVLRTTEGWAIRVEGTGALLNETPLEDREYLVNYGDELEIWGVKIKIERG